jgi:hypothetical protein
MNTQPVRDERVEGFKVGTNWGLELAVQMKAGLGVLVNGKICGICVGIRPTGRARCARRYRLSDLGYREAEERRFATSAFGLNSPLARRIRPLAYLKFADRTSVTARYRPTNFSREIARLGKSRRICLSTVSRGMSWSSARATNSQS